VNFRPGTISDRLPGRRQGRRNPRSGRRRYPGVFLSHFPLRVSLVMVMTGLAALGLVVSGLVVTGLTQQFLTDRVDSQLQDTAGTLAQSDSLTTCTAASGAASGDGSSPEVGLDRPPSNAFTAIIVRGAPVVCYSPDPASGPDISALTDPTDPVTVPAQGGSGSSVPWRAVAVENSSGQTVVVAQPMKGEAGIMHNLITALVAITLGVLFLLVIASFYLVRRALQPLNQVEQTAGRIAEGQLDRRVPDWSPTTEVGRLSVALNRMLEQIQGAFIKVNQSEQQAREAEQQARSAESSMRRFIGDASHELRTPLTSVRGYADLYKSGATEDADMVIDRISSEAGRMSLLVEDLLTLVRMDEGRPMRSDLVDLLELCIAAVDNARAGFPGRSISVQNETGSIPLTVGDQNRLHQVVGNLLTNALRHGGEDASVVLRLTRPDAAHVGIEIADDGVGIAAEDLPHLFERFYRADVSRSRASGGSGLGLSIVKSLVESHGGTITVESTPGEGTTFRIILPAADIDGGDEVAADAAEDVEVIDAEPGDADADTEADGTGGTGGTDGPAPRHDPGAEGWGR
jgi:two-component system OmpR family sensor kinase